jgi:hypothetical protein
MKKHFPVILVGIIVIAAAAALFAFRDAEPALDKMNSVTTVDNIEVFYFHLTRRCVTCQAVENVSRDAVQELYPEEISSGKIVFRSLNIENQENEAVAEKVRATGQCLLVVSGDTRVDLTSEGFMYARSKPEKLKDALKKAIDPLLKAEK